MSDISIIEKELQNGTLLPQGSIHGTVWSVRDGLKIEFISDDENAEKSVTLDSNIILFFWDYEGTRPVWMHKTHLNGNVLLWKYDASIWRVMNLLKVESVRLGVAYYNGFEACCMYIRNSVLAEDTLPENKYAVGMLDEKDNTVLSAGWTGNGFLSVKVRARNSFVQQFYLAEVSGYRYENRHFIMFVELPLVDGTVSLTLGKDIDKKIKVSENSFYTIEEKGCTSISRILKIDFDMEAISRLLDVEGEELCLLPEVVVENQYFPLVATESVLDDRIYDISENHKASLRCNSDGRLKVICADEIYDVLLSVVTAVYNTAPFLSEMIESVLSQKLDKLNEYIKDKFKNVFEFILVDDGSTDGSGEILDNYARMFDCIKVIHKENGGVSSARNTGLEIARGKYVNFADSDDKISENFFEEMLLFFEKNYDATNIITAPIWFFDARNGKHWSSEKFSSKNEIIDLENREDATLMFVNASVFKGEVIYGKRLFDTKLHASEDIKFIYAILIEEKPVLGLVPNCMYYYRRRSTGEESLIQVASKDKNRYVEYFDLGMNRILASALENYDNKCPRYIQRLLVTDIQWRFFEDGNASIARSVLNETEFKEYKEKLFTVLQHIDIDLIWDLNMIWREHKMFMSTLKYGRKPDKQYKRSEENMEYFFDDTYLINASSNMVQLFLMGVRADTFFMEGVYYTFEEESEMVVRVNGDIEETTEYNDYDFNKYSLGEVCFYGRHFRYEKKLDDIDYHFDLLERIDGCLVKKTDIRYGEVLPLSKKYNHSYFIDGGWAIREEKGISCRKICYESSFLANPNGIHGFEYFENEFRQEVIKKNQNNDSEIRKAWDLRTIILNYKNRKNTFYNKKIWLISDRVNVAGDNGEALFIWLNQNKNDNIETYFVINQDCPDFERMKKYGNVVAQGSIEHKILHCMAEYIISSQFDEYVRNPFYHETYSDLYRDLVYEPRFVFLQHGVIKDDLSEWTNRLKKDMYGFVTAAKREYQSILDYPYMYTSKEVWLTGLPRYDRLYHDEKRQITIMPTWRAYLKVRCENDKNRMEMGDNFVYSQFFRFYDSLLNDERLLNAAKKYNYTICFRPHPTVMSRMSDFRHDERVLFIPETVPYRQVYAESDLVITDYSSSVMDFVYLKKPVLYCHFDRDEFFAKHTYKAGYYDYEKDGFGEVTYDMESLIDLVIEYMRNDCRLHQPYKDRINSFFEFQDQNNCKRVYEKLMSNH